MKWQFWRKKPQQADVSGLAFISMERRLLALEQAMEFQRAMLDERTRVMADAISTEFRGVGRIMASLAHTMAQLESKLDQTIEAGRASHGAPALPEPPAAPEPPATPEPLALPMSRLRDELAPPPPANDPPSALRREVDPLLLDALAKGRVAFDITRISSIPPRNALLSLMRFAPPLPPVDSATADRLAELFPDAALLLDRFMMDAAASVLQRGHAPAALPLLVPLSPVSARDQDFPADFRRRFERLNHPGGVYPLFSEAGWIVLIETQNTAPARDAASSPLYAVRASGTRRVDAAALADWGVRYLLAPVASLAAPDFHPLAPDIHAADVARLFARAGIGLIAEDVPDHVTMLGLLRNNVGMGWGPAFQSDATAAAAYNQPPGTAASQDYRAYLRRAGS